jgi:hypothetical protein
LVSAKVDDDLVADAEQILGQSRSVDLAERRSSYEADGWTGFNANAGEYVPDEVDRESARAVRRS